MVQNPQKNKFIISIIALIIAICGLCVAVIGLGPGFTQVGNLILEIIRSVNTVQVELYQDFQPPLSYPIINNIPKQMDQIRLKSEELDVIHHSAGNNLVILVKNLLLYEELILKNYIPLDVVSYTPNGEQDYEVLIPRDIGGGPSFFWNFSIVLPPETGIVRAEFDDEGQAYLDYLRENNASMELPDSRNPNYLNLERGDSELFAIDVRFTRPGIYKFKVGIEYHKNNKSEIKWLDKVFTARVLPQFYGWGIPYGEDGIFSNDLEQLGLCNYEYSPGSDPKVFIDNTDDYQCTGPEK